MKQSNIDYRHTYHFQGRAKRTVEDSPSVHHDPEINTKIKENPYRQNVEIEKDEIVLRPDLTAIHKAGGNKHSKGGTPVYLKPDSFVFSDDKSLSISKKEHELFELKEGGKGKQKLNTPAKVLERNVDMKHYNSLMGILQDPLKDKVSKESAALMLEKYMKTIGNVAYIQEAKKNFPTDIPEFSMGTAPVYDNQLKEELMEQKQYMKYGGKVDNPYLPKMQEGGPKPSKINLVDEKGRRVIIDLNRKRGNMYLGTIDGKQFSVSEKGMQYYMNQANGNSIYLPKDITRPAPSATQQDTTGAKSGRTSTGNRRNYILNNKANTAPAPSTTIQTTNPPATTNNTVKTSSGNPYVPAPRPRGTLFGPVWSQLVKDNPDAFILSPEAQGKLPQDFPHPQSIRKNGMFGEADWNGGDFKQRHQWFFKDNPNFDFKNANDVRKFQSAYNTKAKELGYKDYFVGKSTQAVDGKFGEYTYNAPGFKDKPTGPRLPGANLDFGDEEPKKEDKSTTVIKPGEVDGPAQNGIPVNWEFTPFQKQSQLYNGLKWAGVDREMPLRSQFRPTYMDAALVNPEQTISDMRGVANTQMRSADILSPIVANAQKAAAYGDLLDRLPGVRSQYDAQNVGITNSTRAQNVGIKNNADMTNIGFDQQYWREAAVGRQNFKNMRGFMADQFMNNRMQDVQDNQSLAYNMLTLGPKPAYGYDFKTGNFYRNDKNILDVQSNTSGDTFEAMVQQAQAMYNAGLPEAVISALLRSRAFSQMAPYLGQAPTFGQTRQQKKGGKIGKNPYKK